MHDTVELPLAGPDTDALTTAASMWLPGCRCPKWTAEQQLEAAPDQFGGDAAASAGYEGELGRHHFLPDPGDVLPARLVGKELPGMNSQQAA